MDTTKPMILKLIPLFKERLWGGQKLKKFYDDLPPGDIGECWGISAHQQGDSKIANKELNGQSLRQIYHQFPQWFNGAKSTRFPLLVKIIDAREDLSVQVHPNDSYALANEHDLGKHEAWVVLDVGNHSRLQLGHTALTLDSFKEAIVNKQWKQLLRYEPLSIHDVIDIAPGTLHALCAGTVVLEIQQSSDVTYRVYDYERLDKVGNLRTLHLPQAMAVTTIPFVPPKKTKLNKTLFNQLQPLIHNDHFVVEACGVNTKTGVLVHHHQYRLATVIEGEIIIDDIPFKQGDHFIVTSTVKQFTLRGSGWIIFANIP
jgi:mannose-6-phosphate isomerase class I